MKRPILMTTSVLVALVVVMLSAALETLQIAGRTLPLIVHHRAQPSASQPSQSNIQVAPIAETAPVPSSGDAADDPAIWIHPAAFSKSTIIGTNKKGGLAVYDLTGRQIQYLPAGELNNVDIRHNFPLGGWSVALVTAGNRIENSIAIFRVNPITRKLENAAARTIHTVATYGSCMYHSLVTGKFYYFVNSKSGVVEQWELFDNGAGKVDGKKVRTFDVGSTTEGCVADDDLGYLYIGEQQQGIWKYGAEPESGAARTLVDMTGPRGHLTAEVEGLTLYTARNGTGYLIASSQGSNEFVLYQRENNNEYVTTFTIVAGNGIDGVSHTDGIDAASFNLDPTFPDGVFVVQDHINDGGNQNYKLVSWRTIATAIQRPKRPDVNKRTP